MRKDKIRLSALIGIVAATCMCACSGDTFVHQYQPVDVDGWYIKDTTYFDIPATDEGGEYNISVGLRYQHDFAYSNMWMVIEQDFEQPEYVTRDTLEMTLCDGKDELRGDGTALLQYEEECTSTLIEPHQHGTIKVYHIMHPDVIKGINDVGIMLTRRKR